MRTVRRTFEQLSCQLSSGDNQRLLLRDVGAVDVVYLRAGYQYSDYWAPELRRIGLLSYTKPNARVYGTTPCCNERDHQPTISDQ